MAPDELNITAILSICGAAFIYWKGLSLFLDFVDSKLNSRRRWTSVQRGMVNNIYANTNAQRRAIPGEREKCMTMVEQGTLAVCTHCGALIALPGPETVEYQCLECKRLQCRPPL